MQYRDSNPVFTEAHNRAKAVFLCVMHCYIQFMVGRAGPPKGGPGASVTGSSNPVRLATHEIRTSGGELIILTEEDAYHGYHPYPVLPVI
ncbi:ash family protein [Escherichia coli]|nr:ash family protein [Escherichia coli]